MGDEAGGRIGACSATPSPTLVCYTSGKTNDMASNNDYATKTDLRVLRDELKGDISAVGDELREAIHDSETRLLKAFYEYAESNRLRIVLVETATTTLTKRLDIVEGRLMNIEKKLNLPGHS
ncbi:MAG: hypothetical protein HY648_10295 [Acidobacteria bacterium]|nr:hypothetical protein [Acidobacteriota bacterium]